jgi:hypothetical protein
MIAGVMKNRLQTFLGIGVLCAAFSVLIASCGPERPFCPYYDPPTPADPAGGSCSGIGQDPTGAGGGGGSGPIGVCDGGAQHICNGQIQCVPCGT